MPLKKLLAILATELLKLCYRFKVWALNQHYHFKITRRSQTITLTWQHHHPYTKNLTPQLNQLTTQSPSLKSFFNQTLSKSRYCDFIIFENKKDNRFIQFAYGKN